MSGLAAAHMAVIDQAFGRIFRTKEDEGFASEQERQEMIARVAKIEELDLVASLPNNRDKLRAIAEDMFDKISVEQMEVILICAMRGSSIALAAMQRVILDAKNEAVKDVAEFRAIKAVEEHGKRAL